MTDAKLVVPATGISSSRTAAAPAPAPAVLVLPAPVVSAAARLDALDSLRGLAAIHVFAVHYIALFAFLFPGGEASPTVRTLRIFFSNPFQAAYLFFVLSGFLIYRSLLLRRQTLGSYLARRARRIYPTFAVVFSLYLVLTVIFPARSKLPAEGVAQYLLANAALLPGVFRIRPVITVSWTLSFELFFYLALGIGVIALGMRTWSPGSRALFFLGTIALYLAVGNVFGLNLGPFLMFLPGILLLDLLDQRATRREPQPPLDWRPFLPVGAAAVLAVAAMLGWHEPAGGLATTAATFLQHAGTGLLFGLLVWLSIGGSQRFARFCMWRPLRRLGQISYSFYLLHGLVLGSVAMLLKPHVAAGGAPLIFWIGIPLLLIAAIAAGSLLFAAVEERFSLAPARRGPAVPAS